MPLVVEPDRRKVNPSHFHYPWPNRGERMIYHELWALPLKLVGIGVLTIAAHAYLWHSDGTLLIGWFLCVGVLVRSAGLVIRGWKRSLVIGRWERENGLRPDWTWGGWTIYRQTQRMRRWSHH